MALQVSQATTSVKNVQWSRPLVTHNGVCKGSLVERSPLKSSYGKMQTAGHTNGKGKSKGQG